MKNVRIYGRGRGNGGMSKNIPDMSWTSAEEHARTGESLEMQRERPEGLPRVIFLVGNLLLLFGHRELTNEFVTVAEFVLEELDQFLRSAGI